MNQNLKKINTVLFWDIDRKKIDLSKHKRFIIERILKFGKPEDIRWLRNSVFIRGVLYKFKKSLLRVVRF